MADSGRSRVGGCDVTCIRSIAISSLCFQKLCVQNILLQILRSLKLLFQSQEAPNALATSSLCLHEHTGRLLRIRLRAENVSVVFTRGVWRIVAVWWRCIFGSRGHIRRESF
ncbi:hypothetical protein AVEN_47927-1 [Araneus ventricosus]|uniref:Uncharacterized protein n=1 Tax=Araneus ventricosus TaxID=182803 RepID=A0A4Y2X4I2_ARAVE|nr:hypothetical protein AVEN_47927-1 [Araneus ventricosus]